ncbi:MAG TPA: hypothetical protein DCP02_01485 [Actinobacteria bacterium]|nr:hypothetical protein [Actinomycetota bacterium]
MLIFGWVVIILVRLTSKLKNNRGSTLVLMIILIPVFLLIVGMIVDIGRAFVIKEELNKACMIAAEETSKCININIAESSGTNNLSGEYSNTINYYFYNNYKDKSYSRINYLDHNISGGTNNPKYIEILCEAEVDCFFLKLISIDSIKVHSKANGRLRRIK